MSSSQPARTRILIEALRLFATRGYNAIGVEEIVVSAGVTKPTLYHHFGSKQGVLDTLLVERVDPAIADLATAAAYRGDLPLTLGTVVDAMFAFGQREPELYWMLVAANITATDDAANQLLAARLEKQVQLLTELFNAAVADHGNIRGKQLLAASTLLAMIAIHLRLASEGTLQLDEKATWHLIQQFSYGIYS